MQKPSKKVIIAVGTALAIVLFILLAILLFVARSKFGKPTVADQVKREFENAVRALEKSGFKLGKLIFLIVATSFRKAWCVRQGAGY